MLLPILGLYTTRPLVLRAKDAQMYETSYHRLLYNKDLFYSLIRQQTAAPDGWQQLGISIGNLNSESVILKVCNPYCGPCANAHPVLEELLQHVRGTRLQIIFTTFSHPGDRGMPVVKHLLSIVAKGDPVTTRTAIHKRLTFSFHLFMVNQILFMHKILLLFAWLSLQLPSYSADVTIKYIVDTRSGFHPKRILRLVDAGKRNNGFIQNYMDSSVAIPMVRTPLYNDSSKEVFAITYKTDKEKCYFLADGLGRELLLDPHSGDTITVHIGPAMLINKTPHLNDSVMSPWMSAAFADADHAYVFFFDSLAHLFGDLNVRLYYSYRKSGNDLQRYLPYIQSVYKARIEYLHQFASRNHFPARLRYYAFKEIQYSFYNDLLDPIVYFNNMTDYPADLIDSINTIGKDLNDEDLFNNTSLYKKVLKDYLFSVRVRRGKDYRDSVHLADCYQLCSTTLKGQIRDYMLAALLDEYIKYDSRHYVTNIFPRYRMEDERSTYRPYIDSAYRRFVMTSPLRSDEVLALLFETVPQQKVSFKDIAQKKLVIIDCWATWCLPCKQEQPFIDKLAGEYRDQIQFVALSADQDVIRWRRYVVANRRENDSLITQLHAPGTFEHLFFQKLDIHSIPRYVLVSSAGDILEPDLPRATDEVNFRKTVDHYLNK
jgi:thiol-disulfide isomerase/thioredoxin